MVKSSLVKGVVYWNRKLHIHLGLFLLLFIWLFSLSGLLLNHGDWKFASFWDERNEQKTTTPLRVPAGLDSAGILRYITAQLGAKGEVTEVKLYPDSVDFRCEVPGHIRTIHVDFLKGLCTQNEIQFNRWGILRTLHTFNGVNKENPSKPASWLLTNIWRFTMDAIAVGLALLCFSSYLMWYKLKTGRLFGWLLLLMGLAGALYFVWLLRLL